MQIGRRCSVFSFSSSTRNVTLYFHRHRNACVNPAFSLFWPSPLFGHESQDLSIPHPSTSPFMNLTLRTIAGHYRSYGAESNIATATSLPHRASHLAGNVRDEAMISSSLSNTVYVLKNTTYIRTNR